MCFCGCVCVGVWGWIRGWFRDSDSAPVWGDAPDRLRFPAKNCHPPPYSCCLIPPPLPLLLLHLHSSILSLGFIQSVLAFDPPALLTQEASRSHWVPPPHLHPLSLWLEEDEGRDKLQKQKEKEKQVFQYLAFLILITVTRTMWRQQLYNGIWC